MFWVSVIFQSLKELMIWHILERSECNVQKKGRWKKFIASATTGYLLQVQDVYWQDLWEIDSFFPFSAFKSANYTIKLCYGIALSHFFVKQNFETTVSYRAESPSKFINPLKMSLLFLWSILSRKLNSAWPTCKQKSKQLLGGV